MVHDPKNQPGNLQSLSWVDQTLTQNVAPFLLYQLYLLLIQYSLSLCMNIVVKETVRYARKRQD